MSKVTKKQIEEWKAKHGDVYELPVGDKVAYIKAPNMADQKRAVGALMRGSEIDYAENMLAAIFLGGDEEVKKDDKYFYPAKKAITSLFDYDDPEVEVKDGNYHITIDGHKCIVRFPNRSEVRLAESKNKSNKPFVTQEKLFEQICIEKDEAFNNRNNAKLRMPLYRYLEELKDAKVAVIKKL